MFCRFVQLTVNISQKKTRLYSLKLLRENSCLKICFVVYGRGKGKSVNVLFTKGMILIDWEKWNPGLAQSILSLAQIFVGTGQCTCAGMCEMENVVKTNLQWCRLLKGDHHFQGSLIVGNVSVVLFLLIGSHLHLRVLANVAYESIIHHFQ